MVTLRSARRGGSWNGSWNGSPDDPSVVSAVSAVSVSPVQLALAVDVAIVLIIRRSWVRASPAPPGILRVIWRVSWDGSWTEVGEAMALVVVT